MLGLEDRTRRLLQGAALGATLLAGVAGCSEGSRDAQGTKLSFPVRTPPTTKLGEIEGCKLYLVDIAGTVSLLGESSNGTIRVPHPGVGADFKVIEQISIPGSEKLFRFAVGETEYVLTIGNGFESIEQVGAKGPLFRR